MREKLADNLQQLRMFSGGRGPDDWLEMLISGRREGRADRPLGVWYSVQLGFVSNLIDDSPSTLVLDFVPQTFLLTYKSVSNLFLPQESLPDLLRFNGVRISQREFMFEVRYRDAAPHGDYTIRVTIERLDN